MLLSLFNSKGVAMRPRTSWISLAAFLVSLALPLFSAAQNKKDAAKEPPRPSYESAQPATESLDLAMYQNIRDEAIRHTHVMEYASGLMDGIGPRLTGSPNLKRANEWTRDQFTAMGCANAHLEDWGEFGMGWQQLNTWMRMTSPDSAVFITQAAPWSPATNGAVSGQAIWMDVKKEEDLDKYKGKLAGKVVLLGDMREVKPLDKPLFERMDGKDLAKIIEHPLVPEQEYFTPELMKSIDLRQKISKFLAE